jgi:uncharacterized protein
MKIIITGGLGFVGLYMSKRFLDSKHEVTVIERQIPEKLPLKGLKALKADLTVPGKWQEMLVKNDVIINLAGASIFQKWNDTSKNIIYQSRIQSTRNIAETLLKKKHKNITLINTSAVGYYGFHNDEFLDESAGQGSDFLAHVAGDWEREALKAESKNTRVVICRFGIVLGKNGGVLQQLTKLFNSYLGTRLGNGKQWFSWVHIDDLASIMELLIKKDKFKGAFNCTTPNPVTNKKLTASLSKALKKPVIIPFAPSFALRIIQGEMSSLSLKGQRVIPKRLTDSGFHFKFATIEEALKDIC